MMLNEWLGSFIFRFKYEFIWTPRNEAFDWYIMKPNHRGLLCYEDLILFVCVVFCIFFGIFFKTGNSGAWEVR